MHSSSHGIGECPFNLAAVEPEDYNLYAAPRVRDRLHQRKDAIAGLY